MGFAADGFWHCGMIFVPDEFVASIVSGEALKELLLVRVNAVVESAGDACLDGAAVT